jgi:hypothetical protein
MVGHLNQISPWLTCGRPEYAAGGDSQFAAGQQVVQARAGLLFLISDWFG